MKALQIKNGPGISKLLAAFRDSFADPPETESFEVSNYRIPHLQLQIVGIEHESGAPGLYNIQGNIIREDPNADEYCSFTAFYSANAREGHIKLYRRNEDPPARKKTNS